MGKCEKDSETIETFLDWMDNAKLDFTLTFSLLSDLGNSPDPLKTHLMPLFSLSPPYEIYMEMDLPMVSKEKLAQVIRYSQIFILKQNS